MSRGQHKFEGLHPSLELAQIKLIDKNSGVIAFWQGNFKVFLSA